MNELAGRAIPACARGFLSGKVESVSFNFMPAKTYSAWWFLGAEPNVQRDPSIHGTPAEIKAGVRTDDF